MGGITQHSGAQLMNLSQQNKDRSRRELHRVPGIKGVACENESAPRALGAEDGATQTPWESLPDMLSIFESIGSVREGVPLSPFASVMLTPQEIEELEPRLWKTALQVFENAGKAQQWLETPCAVFNGLSPLEFADTDKGRDEILRVLNTSKRNLGGCSI